MKVIIHNIKDNLLCMGIASLIGIIALGVAEFAIAQNTAVTHNIEIWIDSCNILDFFFPLIVTLPFTWKLYFEKKDQFISYASLRVDKRKYIAYKILAGMITVFVMVFVIYYVGLIIGIRAVKPGAIAQEDILYRYIWGKEQAEEPFVFGFFWCLWKAFIGSVISAFGYAISLLADNLFVITLFPFLYCTIENFVTGTLGIEQYSICTTYILNRLAPKSMQIFHYGAGLISFCVIGGLLIIAWTYRKKQVENSVEYS